MKYQFEIELGTEQDSNNNLDLVLIRFILKPNSIMV